LICINTLQRQVDAVQKVPQRPDAKYFLTAPFRFIGQGDLQPLATFGETMARVPTFYSVNEVKKPAANRVHHNNNACAPGRDIPQSERRSGDGGYRLCDDCKKLS
jgi:hypothetical protein